MSEDPVAHLWAVYVHRFLAEGMPYPHFLDLQRQVKTWQEWCPGWSEAARRGEERAAAALAAGYTATAGAELSRAALYYCFAQFLLWDDPVAKQIAYANCARVWQEAAPYLDPPQERIAIPYRSITLPGYLRLPQGAVRPPCVLLLGGLDSPKEEMQVISNLCVQRGLATLSFDGPGQGETFARMKLAPDFVEAVRAVLDFAELLPQIDASRLGIIGRSLGGYYAPRTAALDKRVKAVVAWGAMYHLRNFRSLPPLTAAGFVYATGSRSLDEASAYLETIDLGDVAARITCPMLIAHSGRDLVTPTENATLLQENAGGPTELLFYPQSGHCFHDQAPTARPAMADFMAKHLAR